MKGKHWGRRLLAAATLLAVLCAAMPSALATEVGYGLMDTFRDYYAEVDAEETPDEPEIPDSADSTEADEEKQIAEAFDKMTSLFSTQADATDTAVTTAEVTYYYSDGTVYTNEACTQKLGSSLTDAINGATKETLIYMKSSYSVSDTEKWEPSKAVTLVRGKTDEPLVKIQSGGKLTLGGNLTLDGDKDNKGGTSTGVHVDGELILAGNASIQNFHNSGNGGGVYVTANGKLTMDGGKITGNASSSCGGGIHIQGGTFYLNGGTVSNNTADGFCGGGVNMQGGTFVMYGGRITENSITRDASATDYAYGGAVAMQNTGVSFEMYGGIITGNKGYRTSAVSVMGGTFTLYGGSVIDNEWSTSNHSETSVNSNGYIKILGGTLRHINGTGGDKKTASNENGDSLTNHVVNIGIGSNALVTSSDVIIKDASGNIVANYGFADTYTDSEGNLYLWLPENYTVEYYHAVIQCKNSSETNEDVGESISSATQLTALLKPTEEEGLTYQWQSSSTGLTGSWQDLTDEISKTYTPDVSLVNQWVRAIITRTAGTVTRTYTSNGVKITAPQLSITVPTTLLVNVKATGECVVQAQGSGTTYDNLSTQAIGEANGTIKNNSAVDIYLTGVTFTWNTAAGKDADGNATPAPSEIFTNWGDTTKPKLELAVGSSAKESGSSTDNTSYTWTPPGTTGKISAATDDNSPGTLELTWSFDLNQNTISAALQAGVAAPIGVITYVVSYEQPAA